MDMWFGDRFHCPVAAFTRVERNLAYVVSLVQDKRIALMHKVFWRCNGGDYYSERFCPFDRWSGPELQRLFDVVAEMKKNAEPISITALQRKGFDKEVLDRVIVVEFG
jgi:hypothetical protein